MLGLVNGFVWSLFLSLMSLGFNLIYGLLGIRNLAHGDFYMLGAIMTWFIVRYIGFNYFWPGLLLILFLFIGFGMFLERFLFRPILENPTLPVVVSLGLSYILQEVALRAYGGISTYVEFPIQGSIPIFSFQYPVYRIVAAIISAATLFALWLFLYKTGYGLLIRASKQSKELALSMGINASQTCMVAFGLGIGLSAITGAIATSIVPVHHQMGIDALIASLIVVTVGGMGSLKGSFIASIIIGETEGIASVFMAPPEARILSLLILIITIIIRPRGLFGIGRGEY